MKFQVLIKQYLNCLQIGDLEKLLSIFEGNAIVFSPLYGKLSAKQFYSDLFNDTTQSKITLLNTFQSNENEDTCSGHFQYDWTMKDGSLVTFECVDVFKISKNNKIEKLTIIYDTFGVRDSYNQFNDCFSF
ncbi:hypothetical protein [Clostridium oceanicum]|uniref:Nuclear transport factor 2 family protein n=1 Tax=Clostridium oceanicum TaxID=1543 RepID=A0ABP3UFG2_9CLOT